MTSSFVHCWYALYKNLPLPGVCLIKSSIGAAFVTLQRPFPVMPILSPTISIFSMILTEAPN